MLKILQFNNWSSIRSVYTPILYLSLARPGGLEVENVEFIPFLLPLRIWYNNMHCHLHKHIFKDWSICCFLRSLPGSVCHTWPQAPTTAWCPIVLSPPIIVVPGSSEPTIAPLKKHARRWVNKGPDFFLHDFSNPFGMMPNRWGGWAPGAYMSENVVCS